MFYIFNSNNVCIGVCDSPLNEEDLTSRSEYAIETDDACGLGWEYKDLVFQKPTEQGVRVDYPALARKLRDSLRNSIDKFLLPSSTINDTLVTEEQKQILIQDSLLLAKWPSIESWPYIPLPTLSDLCKSIITIQVWRYPEQINTTEE